MRNIEKFEAVKESGKSFKELEINRTLYWAYMNSKETGNESIDFSDVIWDYEVEEIVKGLKEIEEKEFTISSTYSGLIEILEKFAEFGCKINGLTKVKAGYTDSQTGEKQIIPAIKMTISE